MTANSGAVQAAIWSEAVKTKLKDWGTQAADLASRLNTEGERAAKLARENRQLNDSTTLEKQSAQLVRHRVFGSLWVWAILNLVDFVPSGPQAFYREKIAL